MTKIVEVLPKMKTDAETELFRESNKIIKSKTLCHAQKTKEQMKKILYYKCNCYSCYQ